MSDGELYVSGSGACGLQTRSSASKIHQKELHIHICSLMSIKRICLVLR